MRDFATAKSTAENDGTEKAKKFRKQAHRTILGFTLVVLALFGTYYFAQWLKEPSQATVAARAAAREVPILGSTARQAVSSSKTALQLGPGEKSEKIPVPYQMTITFGGKDFRVHCVYSDGRDVSFGFGEQPCPTGDMPFQYAENLRKEEPNVVTWKYVLLK